MLAGGHRPLWVEICLWEAPSVTNPPQLGDRALSFQSPEYLLEDLTSLTLTRSYLPTCVFQAPLPNCQGASGSDSQAAPAQGSGIPSTVGHTACPDRGHLALCQHWEPPRGRWLRCPLSSPWFRVSTQPPTQGQGSSPLSCRCGHRSHRPRRVEPCDRACRWCLCFQGASGQAA